MEALPTTGTEVGVGNGAPGSAEAELVAGLRRLDRRAADRLVEETYKRVWAALYRLCGDRDLAEELTQETYAKAWRSLDGFDGRSRISTWLYRIAYTTFLSHVRRPQPAQPFDAAFFEKQAADPDAGPWRRIDGARLRHAVLRLPEELRFAVTARYWGDLSVREIARHEKLTPRAIRKRLHRAVELLRIALGEDET